MVTLFLINIIFKMLKFFFFVTLLIVSSCTTHKIYRHKVSSVEKLPDSDQAMTGIHDIWVLETIGGDEIKITDNHKRPSIEIFVSEKRFVGNDGCNNIFGNIKDINETTIVFSEISSTLKACENMEISKKFKTALNKTRKYQKKGIRLLFLDENEVELLGFKKVD